MVDESLARALTGYEPNHTLIEDLKRKDFARSSPLKQSDVCRSDFLDLVFDNFRLNGSVC